MGLIKEPKGVDFFVDPRPLTEKEKTALSAFIKADKEKNHIALMNEKKSEIYAKARAYDKANKPPQISDQRIVGAVRKTRKRTSKAK